MLGRLVYLGLDAMAALRGHRPDLSDGDEITDADVVQLIVQEMPEELRAAFEGYHIGLIRGDNCRGLPHKARALILGIPKTTYFNRVQAGRQYVQRRINI
jgi:hypothetical protein